MTARDLRETAEKPSTKREVYGLASAIMIMQLIMYVYGAASGATDRVTNWRDTAKSTESLSMATEKRVSALEAQFAKFLQDSNAQRLQDALSQSARDIQATKMAAQIDNMSDYYKRAQRQ